MPEILNSSRSNTMAEMKQSATMREHDLAKAISHTKTKNRYITLVVARPTAQEATNIIFYQ
jgi:hypothetical protein